MSTDFLSNLKKPTRKGLFGTWPLSSGADTFLFQGKKLPCSQEAKRRNLTDLANRALSWNGIMKWQKYISKVHVKIGTERYATAGEICHSVGEARDTRRTLFYVKKIMTNSSLCFACLGTWWFFMCPCISLALFCPYIRYMRTACSLNWAMDYFLIVCTLVVAQAYDLNARAQLFEGRLALNPGFSFLCSKAFSRIIFSVIFRAFNLQLVDKKN